ncbi:MAG: glycosyltransferase [Kiritimatiellae bacterium]|nr:glycosyltransferase [Kiritimatiellia bacterium]
MKRPFFSCVVPVKGARPYLDAALASLAAQGVGDELEVVVQDGDVEPDAGQGDALNKGFAKAKGAWLFWLNADDVLLPGALGRVRDFLAVKGERATDVSWLAGDTVYLDEQGRVRDVRTDAKWRPWFGHHLGVWTGGPSAFFRRELWARLGGFNTRLQYVLDLDLWTRWARAGVRFESLNSYAWGFRVHADSKTSGAANRRAQLDERARVDAQHGVSSGGFWRNVTRAASVLDGCWLKRKMDAARYRGRDWREIGQ